MTDQTCVPTTSQVLAVLCELARDLTWRGRMLNERYLHHAFTHRLQGAGDLVRLTAQNGEPILHPEWPTYKKSTGLTGYGRYARDKATKEYLPTADGSAGFIDFALGAYHCPTIGIEFYLGYGWGHEHLVFDLLKLRDARNPFQTVFSFNVIVRDKALARGGGLASLEQHMNEAYIEARGRLMAANLLCDTARTVHCVVTELSETGRRHWHLQQPGGVFACGLPDTKT